MTLTVTTTALACRECGMPATHCDEHLCCWCAGCAKPIPPWEAWHDSREETGIELDSDACVCGLVVGGSVACPRCGGLPRSFTDGWKLE